MISLSIRVVVASFQHIPLGTLSQLTTHNSQKQKKRGISPSLLIYYPVSSWEMDDRAYSVMLPA